MLFLRTTFRLLHLFLEESSPWQLALGAVLGMFLAVSPLYSLQGMLLMAALWLLRINLFAAITSFVFFWCLAFALAPVLDAVGDHCLTQVPALLSLWAWAYHAPFLPFTLFYRAPVLGGNLLSLLLALPLYLMVRSAVARHGTRVWERFQASRLMSRVRRTRLYAIYAQS